MHGICIESALPTLGYSCAANAQVMIQKLGLMGMDLHMSIISGSPFQCEIDRVL
jgi:hypothetical protein